MNEDMRRKRLIQGGVLCVLPAILFLPAVAALTVCPPSYGIALMRIIGVAFFVLEVYGIKRLIGVVDGPDYVSGAAVLGIGIGLLVIAACIWGFVVPFRRVTQVIPK